MNNASIKTAVAVSITTLFLGACSTMHSKANQPQPGFTKVSNGNYTRVADVNEQDCGPGKMHVAQHMINNNGAPARSIKIRVTGYGAPPKAFYPDPQRRLMAMRAAKIDAYRSLAERVTGVQIWGGTTIGDMVVEKDRFKVYLDTHLTGARVISESAQEDGTYETVVELKVGQTFLNNTLPKQVSMDCVPAEQNKPQYKLTRADRPDSRFNENNLVLSNFYYSKD